MDPYSQYAVVHMKQKKLTWLKGIPTKNDIPEGISWPYVYEGKAFIGLTALDKFPQFYTIDPQTGKKKTYMIHRVSPTAMKVTGS